MPSIGSLCVGSFYSFIFLCSTALLKSEFSGTQKHTPPTVFNLQALDWVHCEEETGVYYELSQFTYKLFKKMLHILKVGYFAPKKYALFKKLPKTYIHFFFFQKEIIGHMYVCTMYNDNFKFTISLKS